MNILKSLNKGRNFISFFFLKALGEATFFILPLIVAKLVSPAVFGSFSLAHMLVMILVAVLITSSQTPFIVHANKEAVNSGKISKSFTIQLIVFLSSIIVGTFAILLFKNVLASFTGISSHHIHYILFFYLGIVLKTVFSSTFLALDKKTTTALYALVVGIVNIVIVLLIAFSKDLQLHHVFFSYFLAGIIGSLLFIPALPLQKLFPLDFSIIQFKETLVWTGWQVFGLAAVQLINWGDTIVLRYFVSFEEIGVYNLAYQFFKGGIGATFIISTYFLPFITKNIDNKKKIHDYLYNKRIKIFFVGLLGAISLYFISPHIFYLIYGDTYTESIVVFQILLIGLVAHLLSVFYIPIINALKKYKFAHLNNVFIVTLNLILNILLIPIFGIIGSAISTVVSYIASLLVKVIYFTFFHKL